MGIETICYKRGCAWVTYHQKDAQRGNGGVKIQVCYGTKKSKKRALLSKIAFNKR